VLDAVALAYALVSCVPSDAAHQRPIVDPGSMARIVQVESHGNPYALHDNATDAEYEPQSKTEALQIFAGLKADEARRCAIARAENRYCLIDVGLAQIDESNFNIADVDKMLDPCANLRASAPLMLNAWRTAVVSSQHARNWTRYVSLYGARGLSTEQIVLRASYSIYNSNSAFGNPAYVARIEQAGATSYVTMATRYADAIWTGRTQRGGAAEVANHDR